MYMLTFVVFNFPLVYNITWHNSLWVCVCLAVGCAVDKSIRIYIRILNSGIVSKTYTITKSLTLKQRNQKTRNNLLQILSNQYLRHMKIYKADTCSVFQLFSFEDHYVLRHLDVPHRSKRSADRHTRKLELDDRVSVKCLWSNYHAHLCVRWSC